MRPEHLRLAVLQGAITTISATIAYVVSTPLVAESVAFGCGVALVGTLFLAWRTARGALLEQYGAGWVLRHAYRTAMERFLLVALLLGMGFKLLTLAALWVFAGFVVGQLAWLAVPVWMKTRTQDDK